MNPKNDQVDEKPSNNKGADSTEDPGQAIQINENTIEDPERPEPDCGDDHLHSRRDFPKRDQALQINENTVDDEE